MLMVIKHSQLFCNLERNQKRKFLRNAYSDFSPDIIQKCSLQSSRKHLFLANLEFYLFIFFIST